jgi:site-specific recombinase XerD
MTKNDLINDIVVSMSEYLDKLGMMQLTNVLIVKLHDLELVKSETLPSTEVFDNEWIMKRFSIDLMASGREESTIKQYLTIVSKFLNDINKTYSAVTGQDITDYLAIRQYRDKISQSYKGTICRYLSSFFGWAYRKKHISEDIMRDVDRVKVPQKRKERLTDEEVEQCREVVKNDKRSNALLEIMLSTGMRIGEICSLNIDDLDFKNDTIRIWGEKSNEYRTGFMTPRFKLSMKAYLCGRTTGPVFIGRSGRLSRGYIESIAKQISIDAGCHIQATVHTYRKTFASVMYRKTSDVLLVSKLLGHASTDVTIKYYLCDDVEDMKYKLRHVA